jgi:hypothetical protein
MKVFEEKYPQFMERDSIVSNTFTLGAVGFSMMSSIQFLTILSLTTAICLNLVLIYKNLKPKKGLDGISKP